MQCMAFGLFWALLNCCEHPETGISKQIFLATWSWEKRQVWQQRAAKSEPTPPLDQNHFKVLHLTRSQGTPSRLLTYVPVWAFCWRCLQWFFLSWYRKSEGTSSNPAKTHVFKVLQKDPQKIRVSATFLTEPKNNKKRSNRKKRGDRTLNELVIQETKVWFLYSATHWN